MKLSGKEGTSIKKTDEKGASICREGKDEA